MQLKNIQKFQCPVCLRELHSFEADVLENHGSWCLVETACRYCGSSSLGLMIGRGKKIKQVKLLSDIQSSQYYHHNHDRDEAEDDYYFDKISKEKQWVES